MLKAFNISPDGVMGVTFKTLLEEAIKRQMKLGSAYGSKEHPAGSPYWYDATKSITFSDMKEGVSSAVGINYSDPLSRQTYRTKQVIDYTFGDWYYYHNDKIPTGYVWNTCTVSHFLRGRNLNCVSKENE